jgi:hypothetical protein
MVIDAILQPGIALGVRTRLALEHDRAAVRKDHPVPDEQHTPLPKPTPLSYCPMTRVPWHEQDLPVGLS